MKTPVLRQRSGRARDVEQDAPSAVAGDVVPGRVRIAYRTRGGVMYRGWAEALKSPRLARKYRRKVQLIFTSPPFPLNRKKKYGNRQGEAYVKWLASFAPI